jgi:hypothetical protein
MLSANVALSEGLEDSHKNACTAVRLCSSTRNTQASMRT